jgi:inorganic pyrophosphatase
VVKVRVVGVLVVEDEKGEDAKVLSVPVNDARFDGYQNITDIHPHRLREIQEFFETYKRLEPIKWAKFKKWEDRQRASVLVQRAMENYARAKDLTSLLCYLSLRTQPRF